MDVTINTITKEGALLPSYATPGSAGADIRAFLEKAIIISPGDRKLIQTGVFVEIPDGYEIQVRPRSGLAIKHGITLLNSPGTIDSDYRGEIGVILYNAGREPFTVENGDRIAQLVLASVPRAVFSHSESLTKTERASDGYGSTGRK